MPKPRHLQQCLESWAQGAPERDDIKSLLCVIADAGMRLSRLLVERDLAPDVETNEAATRQPMEVLAHQLFATALAASPASVLISAESSDIGELNPQGRYTVAIAPLDGAANIATNLSLGTIFSIIDSNADDLQDSIPGRLQRAAGFLYYGPQTLLVLSYGEGSCQFLLDASAGVFFHLDSALWIPAGKHEFAINTSNYRFWDSNLRHFIDDCIAGEDGALGENFNMRWSGSLVAEAFRILVRGGVFLYPGDSRPGYTNGRLRLLYHALPLALIIEQAGGAASDGNERILEMRLGATHARVPLIFGCKQRVNEVIDYISGIALDSGHHPLFVNRGLLRN
jgi:fructose-1,6-bisphosphatase I